MRLQATFAKRILPFAKERAEICEDPPELRGSCSPVKDGEDAEAKLLAETIKKNNLRVRLRSRGASSTAIGDRRTV